MLFDQNISYRIPKHLPDHLGHCSHVKAEGLINFSDKHIREFAKANSYTIVTKDADFNELNSLYGFPPKVIWIRVGNLKTADIAQLMVSSQGQIEKFLLDSEYGCFEIVTFRR